jgi:hypothetical protein
MIKEREMMEKSENQNLRRIERREQIKKIAQIQQYERENFFEKLQEKSYKLQEFMNQKNIMAMKRKEISSEMSKKKEEYMQKFDKIFKKKQIDVMKQLKT